MDLRRLEVLTVLYPFPEFPSAPANQPSTLPLVPPCIRFADCILDIDARRLVRSGQEAHLPPKAFDLLKLLVENRPRVLSKTELIERVWRGCSFQMQAWRKSSASSGGRSGRTTTRASSVRCTAAADAFAAELLDQPRDDPRFASRSVAGSAICWLFCGPRQFPLMDGEHVVGRESDAAIWLDSPKVSRRHAKIVVNGGSAVLIDLDSKNGSFVRGIPVTGPTTLGRVMDVCIGPFALIFRVADGAGSTESEVR